MLIVEYERFEDITPCDVLSIIDEDTDTVIAMYSGDELQELLKRLAKEFDAKE